MNKISFGNSYYIKNSRLSGMENNLKPKCGETYTKGLNNGDVLYLTGQDIQDRKDLIDATKKCFSPSKSLNDKVESNINRAFSQNAIVLNL